jgi:hypothetical protein
MVLAIEHFVPKFFVWESTIDDAIHLLLVPGVIVEWFLLYLEELLVVFGVFGGDRCRVFAESKVVNQGQEIF